MAQRWDTLSPEEFQKLQELTLDSNRPISTILDLFNKNGPYSDLNINGEINLESFQIFMDTLLEVETPRELVCHLFNSFTKEKPIQVPNEVILTETTQDPSIENKKAIIQRKESKKSNSIKSNPIKQPSDLINDKKVSNQKKCEQKSETTSADTEVDKTRRVALKDIACYLSLLTRGRPEDKLEFVFRMYDSDGNGKLDSNEIECIVNHMENVADYLGWDPDQLKPILLDMMLELDYDSDGTVSLQEWIHGGMTTIPLHVLLGFDPMIKEDGHHIWRYQNFKRTCFCNLCLSMLSSMGKKGIGCVYCGYKVHEGCVQKAPGNCIQTYTKSKLPVHQLNHHWIQDNLSGKCFICKKKVKFGNGMNGVRCRWCQIILHSQCSGSISSTCYLGDNEVHILPPTSIYPVVIERQKSTREHSVPEVQTTQILSRVQPSPFQVSSIAGTRPLLVFINPKSGGRQGNELYYRFQSLLNPRQIFNLSLHDPRQGFLFFKDVLEYSVLCCGGDGTVAWVLDTIDNLKLEYCPPVGVISLGTGNDLARCLGWGGGYDGESLPIILKKIENSRTVMMDRWKIMVETDKSNFEEGDPIPTNIINNYFSVGVDAAICVKFHTERLKNPEKFSSRMKNKLWYFEFATFETFAATCKNLHEYLDVECDGVPVHIIKGESLQGIALLNIPYIHGGSNLWGEINPQRNVCSFLCPERPRGNNLDNCVQDISDGKIELVGIEGCIHMGQVKTGFSTGRRLAQGCSIKIRTKKMFPMQIDGEPWMQPPCVIKISFKNKVPMLKAPDERKTCIMNCHKIIN